MYKRNTKPRFLVAAIALIAGAYAFNANGTAQADTVLYSFCTSPGCPDGVLPTRDLLKAGNTLYGTATMGGIGYGTVFSITTAGVFTVLHSFGTNNTLDGVAPYSGLVKIGNRLYGTTLYGGQYGSGTVFSVKTNGTGYAVLHSFCALANCTDGWAPYDGLINVDGMLYGTTDAGGTSSQSCGNGSCGTVFKILPTGAGFQVVYDFCSVAGCADGATPTARLLDVGDALYGTTTEGGAFGLGTVFTLAPCGTPPCAESVMYSFGTNAPDGQNPPAGLIYKTVGNVGYLYGMTSTGGASGLGTVFAVEACGTPPCVRPWLYSFGGTPDGEVPLNDLLAWGGYLYGTTGGGGTAGDGAAFKIRANGLTGETLINSFTDTPDGSDPGTGLVRIGSELYGATETGGNGGCSCGTVFSIP